MPQAYLHLLVYGPPAYGVVSPLPRAFPPGLCVLVPSCHPGRSHHVTTSTGFSPPPNQSTYTTPWSRDCFAFSPSGKCSRSLSFPYYRVSTVRATTMSSLSTAVFPELCLAQNRHSTSGEWTRERMISTGGIQKQVEGNSLWTECPENDGGGKPLKVF